MNMKRVFFLSLALSILYTVYTYTPTPRPVHVPPATPETTPHLPLARLAPADATPTPVPTPVQGKGKASNPYPTLPLYATRAGRMARADAIEINGPNGSPLPLSTSTHGSSLPLSTTVHKSKGKATPTPVDSVTASRRVLPVLSAGKNGVARYNGKDVHTPNKNQGRK